MKKIRTILFDITLILVIIWISGIHIFTIPAMLLRTTWEMGKVESYITAKGVDRKIHLAYVNGNVFSMEFERAYGILWAEEGCEVYCADDEVEIRHSSNGTSTILHGICANKEIQAIHIELRNGGTLQTEVNKDGLFAMIYNGGYKEAHVISAMTKEGAFVILKEFNE